MLGGSGFSFVALKPSASEASGSSVANAGERLPEFDGFDIPLGARPNGRFLRFSGERPDVELGLDVVFLLISSARSAFKFCAGTCAGAVSVFVDALEGDFGGDAGLDGDSVCGVVLVGASDLDETSSLLCFGDLLVFLGDKFGDTSCNGCEGLSVSLTAACAGRTSLTSEVVSSLSSWRIG